MAKQKEIVVRDTTIRTMLLNGLDSVVSTKNLEIVL